MAPQYALTDTSKPMRKGAFGLRADFMRLPLYAPLAVFGVIAAAVVVAIMLRIGSKYSFNVNEGWNAYFAAAAWSGADLYPPPSALKMNTYLPLWFYLTGALGSLVGDNIIAGRILAGAAMLATAGAVFLMVRAMTCLRRGGVTAAVALLAMCGLFYGQYVAADDPQWAGNLLMTLAMLAVVRKASGETGAIPIHLVIPLLLMAGLIKHNVMAAPASIAIYLLLFRTAEFPRFIVWSIVGLAVVCAALFLKFGWSVFASMLYPRPYDFDAGWDQSISYLKPYSPFLVVLIYLAYLAIRRNQPATLIFIYAIASLIQGFVLSGGLDVDINVFFDLAIACSIGLGLLQNAVARFIADETRAWRAACALLAWLGITLTPVFLTFGDGLKQGREVVTAIAASPQQADVAYIKRTPGGVLCENPALCYWAGKDFWVDINTLKILVTGKPELEADFIAKLERCLYPLIQLQNDWEEEGEGPFTENIMAALEAHYLEAWRSAGANYQVPRPNCGATARGAIEPALVREPEVRTNSRESDCELRVQSGTGIIELLVSFDSEVRVGHAATFGELRNRDTSGDSRVRTAVLSRYPHRPAW
jgi:hypothetical protein